MEVKSLKEIEEKKWVNFCDNNGNAWIYHRGIPLLNEENNLSFLVIENQKILAICPLLFENKEYTNQIINIGSLFNLSILS